MPLNSTRWTVQFVNHVQYMVLNHSLSQIFDNCVEYSEFWTVGGALTLGAGVAQDFVDVLVGGVLAQGAHDVGNLVVGHLAVTNSVKETKSLLEVWSGEEKQEIRFKIQTIDNSEMTACFSARCSLASLHYTIKSIIASAFFYSDVAILAMAATVCDVTLLSDQSEVTATPFCHCSDVI